MRPIDTTAVEVLEQLADRIASGGQGRDHGIAWAATNDTDLRRLLSGPPDDPGNLRRCPVEPGTELVWLLWEGAMGMCATYRLFTVELPSGRELLVNDDDQSPSSTVVGVIDEPDDRAHVRAFQAGISGEWTSDPLLVGWPSDARLAFGGVVLLDALAEALRRHSHVHEHLDSDNADDVVPGVGDDPRQRLIEALEEELEEPVDEEHAARIRRQLETAESLPAWLWAIDDHDARQIAALKDDVPPIELYAPPGVPRSLDPLDAADDPMFKAAAALVACGML